MPFNAYSLIQVGTKKEDFQEVFAKVKEVEGVKAVHAVTGRCDILAEIPEVEVKELSEILYKIRSITGVLRTETWIELPPPTH